MPRHSQANLLASANENKTPSTFIDLFEISAASNPDSSALVFGEEHLTYSQLLQKVNFLSQFLRTQGVKKETIVAISLQRSFDLIVSMLAVLKAGGIFLPIDPNYPLDRRTFVLSDAQPICLITTQEASLDLLEKPSSTKVLHLEKLNPEATNQNCSHEEISPDQPAYIIYTSGTTGKPKGAINTHKGLLNLAIEQASDLSTSRHSRVLQFASFSFDAAIYEITLALGIGGTLVMAHNKDILPGPTFVKLLLDQKISHMIIPPSVLAVLPDLDFPDLKVLAVAGEACPLELARHWAKSRRFFNGYGVTEATVCSSVKEFDPNLASLTIGKAMGGTQLLVVDENLELVRPGEIGEFIIGGNNVALGYLNRPELTKEKFIQWGTPPSRFYRTGDLVRLLFDGTHEYVGRRDSQVKVRGFRIELDEIVTTVQEYAAVTQAAAVVRNDLTGSNQIVCYFLIDPDLKVDLSNKACANQVQAIVNGLRSFLKSKLPAHMIPSFLLPIDKFPLTGSVKVDLKALKNRKIEAIAEPEFLPQTVSESKLAPLICDILQSQHCDLSASFLDLGGDSLKAVELAWKLQETLSVAISESDILKANSLVSLAGIIDSMGTSSVPKLEVVARGGYFEPTPSQEIFGVLEKLNVDSSPLNCFVAYEIAGKIDFAVVSQAYSDLFERHESLRLKFEFVNGEFRMRAHDSVSPKLELLDFSASNNQDQNLSNFFAETERISFNMYSDLLLQGFLIKLSDTRSIFVLVTHHAIFDAWSIRIFLQDLFAFTAQRITGQTFLSPLKIQYLDYVVWLRKILALRDKDSDNKYLSEVFKKPLALFDLKEVKPRPAFKSRQGKNLFITLTREETKSLYKYSEDRKLTPFMASTAVLKLALYNNSGKTDITLGGPVSIRNHRELENQIGLFGSAYIIRTSISEDEPTSSFLARVRDNLLQSYKHQVFSIGELFPAFDLEMDLSRTPPYDISLASTMFELELCDPKVCEILGISLKPHRFPVTSSFFDFEFTFNLFDGELELETRFDSALYSEEQIIKLNSDFRKILLAVISDDSRSVREIVSTS